MLHSKYLGAAACAILLCAAANAADAPVDLAGHTRDPFASTSRIHVFLFVRTDCPVTNRYAPELQRLAQEFSRAPVDFWLIYPDATETVRNIEQHISQYRFPGEPLRDPHHVLVKRALATVAPEAAVFDTAGRLRYHGRIDDRWVEIGKARPAARTHDLEDAIAALLAGKAVPQPETHAVGCSLADLN